MNSKRKVGFEEMPSVMAELVEQVRLLNDKMTTICASEEVMTKNREKPSERKVISTDDVSKIIHKTRGTIYRMVGRGELPGYKSGKNLVFFEDEIMDWLIQGKRLTTEEMFEAISKGGHPRPGYF